MSWDSSSSSSETYEIDDFYSDSEESSPLKLKPISEMINPEEKKESSEPEKQEPWGDPPKAEPFMGNSLDSKQIQEAIGFVDQQWIVISFATAVMKHIEYS